jgi:hypothetical protein
VVISLESNADQRTAGAILKIAAAAVRSGPSTRSSELIATQTSVCSTVSCSSWGSSKYFTITGNPKLALWNYLYLRLEVCALQCILYSCGIVHIPRATAQMDRAGAARFSK